MSQQDQLQAERRFWVHVLDVALTTSPDTMMGVTIEPRFANMVESVIAVAANIRIEEIDNALYPPKTNALN